MLRRRKSARKWFTKWETCARCPLHRTATTHVLYRGSSHPDILFIGEAPGGDEDAIGEPFVGKAGRLLNQFIVEALEETHHVTKSRDCLLGLGFANLICCFPIKDPDNPERRGNFRAPAKSEAEACRPHLLELHEIIKPTVIVLLGKVPAALCPPEWKKLTKLKLQHPSYWLRTGGAKGLNFRKSQVEFRNFIQGVFDAQA